LSSRCRPPPEGIFTTGTERNRENRGGSEKLHGAVIEHSGRHDTRVFREVSQLGAELQQLGDSLVGARTEARVAVLFDWENWWAIEYSSGPTVDLKYVPQCRDYFRALSADPRLMMFISESVQNRTTGTWTLYVAHKAVGADGTFLGIILGAVQLSYFEQLYQAVAPAAKHAQGVPALAPVFRPATGALRAWELPGGRDQCGAGHVAPRSEPVPFSQVCELLLLACGAPLAALLLGLGVALRVLLLGLRDRRVGRRPPWAWAGWLHHG